jgi:beta-lactamase class A
VARVGVAARNLTTGAKLDLRSTEAFPAASVLKVGILVEAFRQINAGSVVRTADLDTDLERMITLSDNDAANRLITKLGQTNINATMANLGLGTTVLHNPFGSGARSTSGFNQTSPADMAAYFSALAGDRLVGPNSSKQMRDLLRRAQDTSKLVRGVPVGTAVAHKSGWYPGVANDAGIVYGTKGPYVLAVFSQGVVDDDTGNQLIAAVSKTLYESWGR